jgi:hypothetical protein
MMNNNLGHASKYDFTTILAMLARIVVQTVQTTFFCLLAMLASMISQQVIVETHSSI